MTKIVDIIIPSFNGRDLLQKHLPAIIKNTSNLNKIIVIDNGSVDGTVSWLKEHYPQIVLIENQNNLGYTIPINQGVSKSTTEYFILLNNDVEPGENFLKNVFNYFENDSVFGVSFNEINSSWPKCQFENGKIHFTRGEDKSHPRYSLWASGGSAIFNRQIWDKLGGLNEVFSPFYWEDIDIGYRAWKSGYKIIWDNKSVVNHQHESTSGKLNQNYVNLIRQRNELMFNWLNISDTNLKIKNFTNLLVYIARHPGYLKVVFSALHRIRLNKIIYKSTISDEDVLNKVNKIYE